MKWLYKNFGIAKKQDDSKQHSNHSANLFIPKISNASKNFLFSGIILLCLSSSSNTLADSGPSTGLSGQTKVSLMNLGRDLGIPILVPSYVPDGFQYSRIDYNSCMTSPQHNFCREILYYSIVYKNAQNNCLIVGATGRSLSGADSEFTFQADTPLLGKVDIEFGQHPGTHKPSTTEQLTVPQSDLWM